MLVQYSVLQLRTCAKRRWVEGAGTTQDIHTLAAFLKGENLTHVMIKQLNNNNNIIYHTHNPYLPWIRYDKRTMIRPSGESAREQK